MSRPLQRLLVLLVAFLLSVNAAGAASLRGLAAPCCGGDVQDTMAVHDPLPPCHDITPSAFACDHGDVSPPAPDIAASGDPCGDSCTHCLAHAGPAPASLFAAMHRGVSTEVAFERPPFAEGAARPAPPRRLERPPATAALP